MNPQRNFLHRYFGYILNLWQNDEKWKATVVRLDNTHSIAAALKKVYIV